MDSDGELTRVVKLQGISNLNIWKFQVKVILKGPRVWEITQGTHVLPAQLATDATTTQKSEYEKKITEWHKADGFAQKIIATTVTDQCMVHLFNCDTSKEMWDKLKSLYEKKSEALVHILQQQWFTATKDPSDINTHIAKLIDLAHRMRNMGETISDKMLMTKILLTLPPNYDHFINAWESTTEAKRTKDNLISRLSLEELRQNRRHESRESALASNNYNSEIKDTEANQILKVLKEKDLASAISVRNLGIGRENTRIKRAIHLIRKMVKKLRAKI